MNQGLSPGLLRAVEPRLEILSGHRFKYHVDFDRIIVDDDVAAICASRPTNPSGNVLTNEEVHRLASIARNAGVPLIMDNAYGLPFPGILFRSADPIWDDNIILTLSLSNSAATRTGIVVAQPENYQAIASMTAIVGLANCSIGQAIVLPLLNLAKSCVWLRGSRPIL
jgi:valine--pyruvate aminotransferase